MPTHPDDFDELLRLRWELAHLDLKTKLLRLQLALRYDENQPRAPAGGPDGGQWVGTGGRGSGISGDDNEPDGTSPQPRYGRARQEIHTDPTGEASWHSYADIYRADGTLRRQIVDNRDGSRIESEFGAPDETSLWDTRHTITGADGTKLIVENTGPAQTILDERGQAISRTVWGDNGPEEQPLVQPVFARSLRGRGESLLALGTTLYNWQNSQSTLGTQAVIKLKAREYVKPSDDKPTISFIGSVSQEKIRYFCKKMNDIQKYTNTSAEIAGTEKYFDSPASYGTAVHTNLDHIIYELRDPNLRSEVSYLKAQEESRGTKNSIRVDVLENAGDRTVCVYDIKTGKKGLSGPRMLEIATNVINAFGGADTIFVTEMRPKSW